MKTNNYVYFFGYLAQGLLFVTLNTYIPVLLVSVLTIPEAEIAFAQFISYLALFAKPAFALLSDKMSGEARDILNVLRKEK